MLFYLTGVNVEGTNSSKFVSDVCVDMHFLFRVCAGIGSGTGFMHKVLKCAFASDRVWSSSGDFCFVFV